MRRIPLIPLLFNRRRLPCPLSTIVAGIVLYVLGAGLANYSGVSLTNFVRHWYLPLFIAGFVWVSSILCWAFNRYEPILKSLASSFEISATSFEKLVEQHVASVYNDRFALYFEVPILASGFTYVLLSAQGYFWVPDFVREDVLQKPLMLSYFVVITLLAGGVGTNGLAKIVQHILFIRRISRIPLSLGILRVRKTTRINDLASFSLASSLTWNVGLAMVTPIFFAVPNVFTLVLFLLGIVVGISFFVMPQYQLHRTIVEAKRKLSDDLDKAALDLKPGDYLQTLALTLVSNHVENIKEWPFDMETVWKESFSVLIPVVAYLVQTLSIK